MTWWGWGPTARFIEGSALRQVSGCRFRQGGRFQDNQFTNFNHSLEAFSDQWDPKFEETHNIQTCHTASLDNWNQDSSGHSNWTLPPKPILHYGERRYPKNSAWIRLRDKGIYRGFVRILRDEGKRVGPPRHKASQHFHEFGWVCQIGRPGVRSERLKVVSGYCNQGRISSLHGAWDPEIEQIQCQGGYLVSGHRPAWDADRRPPLGTSPGVVTPQHSIHLQLWWADT